MKSLIEIQEKLKAPKNQTNSFGKYKYRSCEDILEAVKPLLAEHNATLTLSDKVLSVADIPYIEVTAEFTDSDGKTKIVTACAGIDVDKKGMDVAQCFGTSSSYARKYALNGLFLIDDTKDSDSQDNSEQQGFRTQQAQKQQRVQQQKTTARPFDDLLAGINKADVQGIPKIGNYLQQHSGSYTAEQLEQLRGAYKARQQLLQQAAQA